MYQLLLWLLQCITPLVRLAACLGQHDVVLLPPLIPRDNKRYCWPCYCVTAARSVPHAFSDLCLLGHGSSLGEFSSSEFDLPPISLCRCLLLCLLSVFRLQCGYQFHKWGLNHWGLHHCNPLEYTHDKHLCLLVMVLAHTRGALSRCSLKCLRQGWASHYSVNCPPGIQSIQCDIVTGDSVECHLIPSPALHGRLESFLPYVFHLITQATLNL